MPEFDADTAFGDPDAMEKAAAIMAEYETCKTKRMHCPWVEQCKSDPAWICPIDLDEFLKAVKKEAVNERT